jgi:hypothetical protein
MSKTFNGCLLVISFLASLVGCKPSFQPESPIQKENSRQLLTLILESDSLNVPKDIRIDWLPIISKNCINASLDSEKCMNFVIIGANKDVAISRTAELADQIRNLALSSVPPKLRGIHVSLTPISPRIGKECGREITPATVNDCYNQHEAVLARIGAQT